MQELSNKAAARYDKANSQHAASKEMIRVAETQLAACRAEQLVSDEPDEPSSPSPLDLAWQEMLNHATSKVSHRNVKFIKPSNKAYISKDFSHLVQTINK